MYNGQFLLEYKEIEDREIPKENNEGKLYKMLEIFDDNLFVAVMATNRFEKSLGLFEKSEGEQNSFDLGLDTLYHMNMYIRMLATLDDILIKIGVYTHLVDKEKSSGQLIETYAPKKDEYFRNKYQTLKLEKKGYQKLPSVDNRYTRKYRNDITHGNELMITKGTVIEKGITMDKSPSFIFDYNLNIFNETKQKMMRDLDIIYSNQNFYEKKITNLIDVKKRTY